MMGPHEGKAGDAVISLLLDLLNGMFNGVTRAAPHDQ